MTENKNYIGYRIKLYPTSEQIKIFMSYIDTSRFVYNLGIELAEKYYEENKDNEDSYKSISFISLNNQLTSLKREEKYAWLNEFDSTTLKLVLKDVIHAYKKFFEGYTNRPIYKKKKYHTNVSFPIRSERLMINQNSIRVSSIGEIYSKNNLNYLIGYGSKESKSTIFRDYKNARIVFDGIDYWLTFELAEDIQSGITTNSMLNRIDLVDFSSEPVGIDMGCKGENWIVASNGMKQSLPDFSKQQKKLRKWKKKFNRQEKVRTKSSLNESDQYSKNQIKTMEKIAKYRKKITNKRRDAAHNFASKLVQTNPTTIVMEDLYSKDMIDTYCSRKNVTNKMKREYTRKVLEAALYDTRRIITKTAVSYGINVIIADKYYPSSQICSNCGNINNIGMSNVYRCPVCGAIIDRDLNASNNLKSLAL